MARKEEIRRWKFIREVEFVRKNNFSPISMRFIGFKTSHTVDLGVGLTCVPTKGGLESGEKRKKRRTEKRGDNEGNANGLSLLYFDGDFPCGKLCRRRHRQWELPVLLNFAIRARDTRQPSPT